MTDQSKKRVLGVANYEARWVAKSLLVRLTANGILPCANYDAQLEKRPERVVPPMWDMVFLVEDVCLKALRPFSINVVMPNTSNAKEIIVRDAAGEHHVPILQPLEISPEPSLLKSAADLDQYIVYAKLPNTGDGHHGCIVVPADTFVTAIHYRAFGPASKADCESFAHDNCRAEMPDFTTLNLVGGEIPWPLASQE